MRLNPLGFLAIVAAAIAVSASATIRASPTQVYGVWQCGSTSEDFAAAKRRWAKIRAGAKKAVS